MGFTCASVCLDPTLSEFNKVFVEEVKQARVLQQGN
jgi:hypothetical protein